MDFSLFKNLDKAFDSLEKTVTDKVQQAALNIVDEFPDRSKTATAPAKLVVTATAAGKARTAQQAWEEFDLEGRKVEWEELCEQIKQAQGANPAGSDALSAWQQRAKDAEYKLYQMCSLLLDVPDPVPFLENVAALSAKIVELESQNRELQSAADSATADMAEVQQLVDRHSKLEAAHKELQEHLAVKDAELAQTAAAASEALAHSQLVAEQAAEIARLQANLRTLRDEYEKAQSSLFEVVSRQEADAGRGDSAHELVLAELERTQARVVELEREKAHLTAKLNNASTNGHAAAATSSSMGDEFWERQLALREEQLTVAGQQLEAAQRQLAEAAVRHDAQIANLENQLSAAQLECSRLSKELSKRPDASTHSALMQRVEALTVVVDLQMEQEGWDRDSLRQLTQDLNPHSAHQLLQERNRKLSAEVSSIKRQLSDREQQIADITKQLNDLQSDLNTRQALILKLEEDLSRALSSNPSSTHPHANGKASPVAVAASLPPLEVSLLQPLSTSASQQDTSASQTSTSASSAHLHHQDGAHASAGGAAQQSDTGADTGGGSLLDIVVSQRDRFRQRAVQLEDEKGRIQEQLTKCQQQLESCRADNVALYEKVRFLERYSQKQAAAAGRSTVLKVDELGVAQPQVDAKANRYRCGPLAFELGGEAPEPQASIPTAYGGPGRGVRSRGKKPAASAFACFGTDEGGDEEAGPEAKYAKAYEARMNPFAEFQQSEAERQMKSLQLHDKALLAGSKLLMGNRVARVFVATYMVLLHVFIAILMYYSLVAEPAVSDAAGASAAGNVETVATAG